MSTTTNYTTQTTAGAKTRRVDLYILGDLNFGVSEVQKNSPTLSTQNGGKVCAGLVKLAQKVLCVLLSYSIAYDVKWGTNLYACLLTGNFVGFQRNLNTILSGCIDIVTRQVQSTETPDMPPDETLQQIQVNNVSIDRANQKVILSIMVVSNTQEATSIVVPISVVP